VRADENAASEARPLDDRIKKLEWLLAGKSRRFMEVEILKHWNLAQAKKALLSGLPLTASVN
jgi:hypothetical protein